MLRYIRNFIKNEVVLCVTLVCAALTMILVPLDSAYSGYIDVRVLCLLLSLMAVVAGFQACGVFRWLTCRLLRSCSGGRLLGVMLVLLPFFSSMLVTNDVALLVFVPFTLALLSEIGCEKSCAGLLVLQTVAANLGSMATPVGNPQNLYLYAAYDLSAGEFFSVMLPLTALSAVCLTAAAAFVLPARLPAFELKQENVESRRRLIVYGVLFVLCLLTVFKVIPYAATLIAVIAAVAVMDRGLLRRLDYALLLTFVGFFIISGNLSRVEPVRDCLQQLLEGSTLLTGAAASQIISNVPAAVLLSEFTDNCRELLLGVNIGGLGTPVASLASLITLKLYMRSGNAKTGRFLALFTLVNIAGLALLLPAAGLLLRLWK